MVVFSGFLVSMVFVVVSRMCPFGLYLIVVDVITFGFNELCTFLLDS